MKSKIVFLAPLMAVLAVGWGAPAAAKSPAEPGKSPRQCFWTRSVNNFAAADEHTVNVRVGVKDVYQFEMFGACPNVDWSERVALVSHGSSWICSGLDAEIITRTPTGPQRCPVRNIRKLTPTEIAALPKRAKP